VLIRRPADWNHDERHTSRLIHGGIGSAWTIEMEAESAERITRGQTTMIRLKERVARSCHHNLLFTCQLESLTIDSYFLITSSTFSPLCLLSIFPCIQSTPSLDLV